MDFKPEELQALLLSRADHLRSYISLKIPERFQRLICVDDVLQEVWISAHGSRITDIHELDQWLLAVANSKIVDAIRMAGAIKRGGELPPDRRLESVISFIMSGNSGSSRTPSREASAREADSAVHSALAEMPDEWRRAIELRYLNGLSNAEVARSMKKSKSAVNGIIFRALRSLQNRIGSASRFFSHAGRGSSASHSDLTQR